MFSQQEILEEFVSYSYLADTISPEAKFHQMYLQMRRWKNESWRRMRNDPVRWRRYLDHHSEYKKDPVVKAKISAYMKSYSARPEVKARRRAQRRDWWERNKCRINAARRKTCTSSQMPSTA